MYPSSNTIDTWPQPERTALGAAIIAAPLFWLIAFFVWQPAFNPSWPLDNVLHFLYLVLLIPVIEELCFRGAIQPYLSEKTSGKLLAPHLSQANVITSMLFVAVHLIHQPVAWALATFVPSLIFGWLRERTGKTWPAIAMHSYYNAGFFYLMGMS